MNSLYINERTELIKKLANSQTKKQLGKDDNLLKRWMQQPPFSNKSSWLDEKLHAEQLPKELFLKIAQTPDIQSIIRPHASWSQKEESLLKIWLAGGDAQQYQPFLSAKHPELCFLNLCLPITTAARQVVEVELNKIIKSHPGVLGNPEQTAKMLSINLFDQLIPKMRKTLITEINFFKESDQLTADSSEGRFIDYAKILNTKTGRQHFFDKYPLLIRQLVETTNNWQDQSIRVVQRLANDYEQICQSLFKESSDKVGVLTKLQFGAGDVHNGGQTVAIISFKSGNKLVYKPRSLATDQHFQILLNWINHKTDLGFAQLSLLNKDDYGWVEFIAHNSCTTKDEVLDYYYRIGGYLAVLYTLEATDFHYENIIACGSQPYLIDLESFFHPYFSVSGMETNQSMDSSVLRTGLLPNEIGAADTDEGIDISGLTDVEGKKTTFKVSTIKANGTDQARLVREYLELPGAKNIPLLNGRKIKMSRTYKAQLKKGFANVYRVLANNKGELIDPQLGLLSQFENDEIRVLFRDTMVYAHLMEESYHPQIQKNGLELDRHYDWLWAAAPSFSLIKQVIPYEKASMLQGDVPIFNAKVGSRHLCIDKNTTIENFFDETGLELVKRRLSNLNEKDLERQCWIIDACLEAQISTKDRQNSISNTLKRNYANISHPASKEQLLAQACKVGDYLEQYAFKGTNAAEWMVIRIAKTNKVKLTPMSYDLFSGLPGEILFLAQLGQVTQNKRYTLLAEKALNSLKNNITYGKNNMGILGLYSGWGSIFHLFTTLAELWHKPALNDYLNEILSSVRFEELIKTDRAYGIVQGLAGFIIAMLEFYNNTGNTTARSLAIQAGEQLSMQATLQAIGFGWKITSEAPLAGYSHGASGISVAFNRLYQLTGEERYLKYIKGAISYENSLFIEAVQNWQDKRDITTKANPGKKMCATGWAHGAPGIALARMELLTNKKLDKAVLKNDLEIAISTTKNKGIVPNHTLSMGAFGTLGVLYEYSLKFPEQELSDHCYTLANKLLATVDQHGWLCRLPNHLITPGLMTGITGIGYQCLRMAAPNEVSSVLSI